MPRHRKPPRLEIRAENGKRLWVIRDGQRYKRTGCLESEAERAAEVFALYVAGRHRPQTGFSRAAEIKLADILALYLDTKEATIARPDELRARIKRLNDFWGDLTPSDIKGDQCRRYVKERGAVIAARRELETMRAAVKLYAKEHGLDMIPLFTLPPDSISRERWLTRSEAARLLWAAYRSPRHKHLVRFILIGLYTGTRHRAILGLQWMPNTTGGWVDERDGVLHRRASGERETKKRRTPMRIPSRLMAHLRRWRKTDHGVGHVVRHNGAPLRRLEKSFRSVREAAGLDELTPHDLRRTRATWLAQAGVPIWEAAGSLGMSAKVFEDHYGVHHPDFQKKAAEAY